MYVIGILRHLLRFNSGGLFIVSADFCIDNRLFDFYDFLMARTAVFRYMRYGLPVIHCSRR